MTRHTHGQNLVLLSLVIKSDAFAGTSSSSRKHNYRRLPVAVVMTMKLASSSEAALLSTCSTISCPATRDVKVVDLLSIQPSSDVQMHVLPGATNFYHFSLRSTLPVSYNVVKASWG